ncbi:hypothetical protein B0O99DRAFT_692718 [Bisporella sp. PMI_857]|nr:hypothetical protein B0O99DRAFT_692718 [Bisporella sp. PMI_857]
MDANTNSITKGVLDTTIAKAYTVFFCAVTETVPILVGGPYRRHRPLEQFNRVILLGGEDGASFTVPLLQDLERRWGQGRKIVTTKVTFVWTVKQRWRIAWFKETLQNLEAYMKEEQLNLSSSRGRSRFEVCMSIYVTADSTYTELETISNSGRAPNHPQCALDGHAVVMGVGVTDGFSNISALGMGEGAETVVEQSEMGPHDPCSTSTTTTTITSSPYSYADSDIILCSSTSVPAASVSSVPPAALPPTISALLATHQSTPLSKANSIKRLRRQQWLYVGREL